jgi:hypothetical protein
MEQGYTKSLIDLVQISCISWQADNYFKGQLVKVGRIIPESSDNDTLPATEPSFDNFVGLLVQHTTAAS